MIATRQSKQSPPSSNKIPEKSIKNITKAQTAAAAVAGDKTISSATENCADGRREEQSKKKNTQQQQQQQHHQPTNKHHQHNNHHQPTQHQPNETRSEIKQTEASLHIATGQPALKSSPSSPLAVASQAGKTCAAGRTVSPTMATTTNATSLLTASTKIQQRQQKFLAAAAKSATSPQNHNHFHYKQPQQHNAWQASAPKLVTEPTNATIRQDCGLASGESASGTCSPSVANAACCQLATGMERREQQQATAAPAFCQQQMPLVRCCPLARAQAIAASDKSVASECSGAARSDKASDRADGEMSDHHHHHHHQVQQQQQQHQRAQQRARVSLTSVGASDGLCGRVERIVGSSGSGASSESSVTAINRGDICRGMPVATVGLRGQSGGTEFGCEYRQHQHQLSHQVHHHPNHPHHNQFNHQQHHHNQHHNPLQQHSPQQQQHQNHPSNQQPEVRRSCEQDNKEDKNEGCDNNNIKKGTINKQFYQHHEHNNQLNYPRQFQYQTAHQLANITAAQNQLTPTVTSPMASGANPTHQQQVMAHYKFHNDCQSSVLTYEQVKRLDLVMDQVVPVHGRGNAPTLYVKLKELIRLVKHKLQHEHSIEIRDVRLNGGGASYILAPENSHYNDLDLIFGTDLSDENRFDVIRDVVLECLMEFYPKEDEQQKPQSQNHQVHYEHCGPPSGDHSQPIDNDKQDVEGSEDDDAPSEEASIRRIRSASFGSDDLNITTNEEGEQSDVSSSDDDDQDDNIIVRIDDINSQAGQIKQLGATSAPNTSRTSVEPLVRQAVRSEDASVADANESKGASSSQLRTPPQQTVQYQYQMPPNNCAIKEAYVHKMVKVNDDDRWSLISLGVQQSDANNYNHMQQQQQQNQQQVDEIENLPACCMRVTGTPSSCDQMQQPQAGICQQNQIPNGIELKFVDRMRRKFEFSVDSFQIILDSLIQFYDYAPQSTITIQRRSSDSSPLSAIMGSHPLMARRSSCQQCCNIQMMQQVGSFNDGGANKTKVIDKFLIGNSSGKMKKLARQNKSCHETSMNSSQSYYDLPLEPGNSLSNSSVASSSGCSSSSSVVSSSSLSCDEDHEDLYCDADNSPSSSASTSSLLSSTTGSMLSSGNDKSSPSCDPPVSAISELERAAIVASVDVDNDQTGAQKSITGKPKTTMKHTSKNDCSESTGKCTDGCEFGMSKLSSCAVISENFYPTVIGRSEYGNFKEALYHLEKKLIATRSPEEIRGGGLLKYCNLLVKNYKPTNVLQIRTLERYMCSRFFIDFSDLNQQRAKLESYLANHFSDDPMQKFHYLTILHNVVQRSTVCLMNHELRLTLNMIRELAYELNEQQQHQQGHAQATQQQQQQHQSPGASNTQSPALPNQHSHQQVVEQAPQQQQQQQPQSRQYQQQNKPTVMQSGAYRVKLVNYALAKPIKS